MHHKYEFHYCPVCGGRLHTVRLKEHEPSRLVCSECGFVFYLDPKLAACVVVERDGRILLTKRNLHPQKGKWALPGGHVDRGEVVETAALRETEEECGIQVQLTDLLGIYSNKGETVVVVVYLARHLSGEPVPDEEIQEIEFFRPEEIPWGELAFPSTVEALREYSARRKIPRPLPSRNPEKK